jgi:hypothetical protein
MAKASFFDLPEHGLHLVPFDDARFPAYLNEILAQRQPFPLPPLEDLKDAAILLNESGKWVIVLEAVWRFRDGGAPRRTHRLGNLHSTEQLEILTGRTKPVEGMHSGIAPGSKRLVTERGLIGSNLSVSAQGGGGSSGTFVTAMGGKKSEGLEVEVSLDVAIFDDGRCAGPDTGDLFSALRAAIEAQEAVAKKAVKLLQSGAPEGQVFDLLLPLARSGRSHGAGQRPLMPLFSHAAMHHLIHSSREGQIRWFEGFASPATIALHRTT